VIGELLRVADAQAVRLVIGNRFGLAENFVPVATPITTG